MKLEEGGTAAGRVRACLGERGRGSPPCCPVQPSDGPTSGEEGRHGPAVNRGAASQDFGLMLWGNLRNHGRSWNIRGLRVGSARPTAEPGSVAQWGGCGQVAWGPSPLFLCDVGRGVAASRCCDLNGMMCTQAPRERSSLCGRGVSLTLRSLAPDLPLAGR